jgi:Tfp pilus assembly protein PilN
MEYLIGIIVLLVGGFIYQKSKTKEAQIEALIADTKGQDKQLVIKENEIKREINVVDARLEEIKKIREQQVRIQDEMSLADRAKAARNKFQKGN